MKGSDPDTFGATPTPPAGGRAQDIAPAEGDGRSARPRRSAVLPRIQPPVEVAVEAARGVQPRHSGDEDEAAAPAEAMGSPRRVCVIGGSDGSRSAIETFLGALPARPGAAFLAFASDEMDVDRLRALPGVLPVRAARDGEELVEDMVFVVPPGHGASFEAGRLRLEPLDPKHPVDRCLRALAGAFGPRSVAVILSGSGEDGAVGVEMVAEAGGTVVVQTPESAECPGMPRRALETGRADHVLAPTEAARVVAWLGGREAIARRLVRAARENAADSVFAVIRELVEREESYGLDHFEPGLIAHRILQRMISVGTSTPEEYAERLRWEAQERRALRDTLIDGEAGFFRDGEAWRTLQESVVRRLVADAGTEPIRVWVVGCSTGHDAYAVALLFEEEMRRVDRRVPYKVFATDLLAHRVERASAGQFDEAEVAALPGPMIERGFRLESGRGASVTPSLRRHLVFARHDVRSDPAFTRLDLIVCRGVLRDFDDVGRRQALARMVYGLRPRGTMFLDGDDGVANSLPSLQPLHSSVGIHARRSGDAVAAAAPATVASPSWEMASDRAQRGEAASAALDAVLGEGRSRMCLLVAPDGRLLHAFGDTGRFLAVRPGELQTRVPELLIESLHPAVEAAMASTLRTGRGVTVPVLDDVPGQRGPERIVLEVTVAPVPGTRTRERQLSVVVEAAPAARSAGDLPPGSDDGEAGALRAELERVREGMHELGRELTATLQQRRALSEELQETSRRAQEHHAELLSVNQELFTVNREHEAKIRELVQLNNDMENLLRTAHIGTVFLDHDLRVRRRTPAADVLFHGEEGTVDRVERIQLPAEVPSLTQDLQRVLREETMVERQMRLHDGRDYLLYLHPYRRTDDGRLDGVVITIVDVTDLKRAERQLRRLNDTLQSRNQEAEAFAHTVSHDLKSPLVTIGCMMGLLREALAGHPDPEPSRFVDQTEATVQSMRQTIDDLLELSRVGRTRNRISAVDLDELVREVLQGHALEIARERVRVQAEPGLPTIDADRRRLFQVLDNLVGNALKYGCGGERPPAIEIDVEDDDQDPDRILLTVADHGSGVPEGFREQVFGLFQRLRRDRAGTGVGLALVRRIVEAHGGRAWVDDRPGGGARFRLSLPKTAPDDDDALELPPVGGASETR